MRVSVRSKLILAIGAPLLVVYLGVLSLGYRASKKTAMQHMKEHLTELTSHHAAKFGGEFSTVAQVARCTANFLTTHPDTTEKQIYDLLRANVEEDPRIYGSCIAFEPNAFRVGFKRFAPYVCRGKEGLRSLDIGREAYDYLRWDWYLIPKLLEKPIWTEPYYDEGAGNVLMCTFSIPFWRDENLRGIATVDVSLEHIHERLSATRIEGGYCTVISRHGRFISHPTKSLVMRETVFSLAEWHEQPTLAEVGREMIAGGSDVRRAPDFQTLEDNWLVFSPIASCGWSLGVVIPGERVMAPVYAELRRNVTLMLSGLVAILGIVLLTAIRITRPIEKLAATMSEVATGDLDAQVTDIHTRDEIGEFAQTFNKMVADLKDHVEALTRETAAREAVEGELRAARNIQSSLIPRTFPPFPDREEFSLHAVNLPAKQVAGDFFDFFFVSDDQLIVVIADVSGKGVPAALLMAVTRTLIKNLAMAGLGPAEILETSNDILAEDNEAGMFVTVFLSLYDTGTGRLRYASAGHNPPYRLDSRGTVASFGDATGVILGAFGGQKYGEEEINLAVEETIVLYTDGVTEARAPNDEMFGEQRFEALLARYASDSAERVCDGVAEAVDEYQMGEPYDDVTVVVLRRNR